MDFAFSPEVLELGRRVRDFVEGRVQPLEPRFFSEGFGAVAAELEGCRREVRELGLWAPQLPRSLGGLGLSLLDFAHLAEGMGRSPLGHFAFNCQAPDAGNLEVLFAAGSEEQKRRWLVPLAAGEIRSCFAMTEPDRPGSNPVWMDTRATRGGALDDDGWVLAGRKWFTSSAEGAALAVVMAVTDPEAAPHRRASLFLVPTETPGFRRVRNLPVMGGPGDGWASHAELELDGCRVGPEALLGAEGDGFRIAQERLGPGRIHHGMRWIGVAERAFDLLCDRAASRELAPGEPLGSRQLVQAWIAESRAAIDASRLLVLETAWRIEREGARAARDRVSLLKFHVARVMGEVLDRAIQAHGALGLTDETPLAWLWRHERAARIYDGPDEVHLAAAARQILERRRPGESG